MDDDEQIGLDARDEMGPEGEAAEETDDPRKAFLPRDFERDKYSKAIHYDLETEFGKTKATNSLLSYLIIAGFLLILVTGTAGINLYIDAQSRKNDINIKAFQGMKLSDILQSSDKYQKQLLSANMEMKKLQERLKQLKAVKGKVNKEAVARYEKMISDKQNRVSRLNRNLEETKKKLEGRMKNNRALLANYKKQMADRESALREQLDTRYQQRIEKTQSRLESLKELQKKALKKKEAEFLARIERQKKAFQAQLKNRETKHEKERKLTAKEFEERQKKMQAAYRERMEKQKKAFLERLSENEKEYVLKYNPRFRDPALRQALAMKDELPDPASAPPVPAEQKLVSNRITGKEELDTLKKRIKRQDMLVNRLLKVPYTNSVEPTLRVLRYLNTSIRTEYNRLLDRSTATLEKRKRAILAKEEEIATRKRTITKTRESVTKLKEENQSIRRALRQLKESGALNKTTGPEKRKRSEQYYLDNYGAFFEAYSRKEDINGFIIFARDRQKMTVYISRTYRAVKGKKAFIFRNIDGENRYIGRIAFLQGGNGITRAKLAEIQRGKHPAPLDRIILELADRP